MILAIGSAAVYWTAPVANLWKVLLIAILSVSLVEPARAESLDSAGKQIYAGIAVVSAAVVVGVVFIVLHEKHKTNSVTGCVSSRAGRWSVTDDKKKVYALSGDPVGIKPDERMTLEGRLGGKTLTFNARRVTKDLGACLP